MIIKIINPGIFTSVQDAGRFGYMKSGIGTNGVMDRDAYRAANAIAGNAQDAAVLEMTMSGITAQLEGEGVIVLTGADMDARLDGVRIERYTAVPIAGGERLTMGMAGSGVRAYLAVRGGLDVPKVLGSRSTNLECRFGGYEGRVLRAGDEISSGVQNDAVPGAQESTSTPAGQGKWKAPHYNKDVRVRIVPGPQADYFTGAGWQTFLTTRYEVSPQSDRMGIRLVGAPVESVAGVDIVSDGVTEGSIQIPKSGMPIILMADHQTTGGYAKIATVVSFDLPLLAQAAPGSYVSFRSITIEEAQDLYLHPEKRDRSPDLAFCPNPSGHGAGRHAGWSRSRTSGRRRRPTGAVR